MASSLGEGFVTIRNCPSEPQITDLCNMLNSMGAKIEGVGTDTLRIEGVSHLTGTTFRVVDDYLEIGTYAIAAAITGGNLKINCDPNIDLEPIMVVLRKFGLDLEMQKDGFKLKYGEIKSVEKVVTNIWPGFPTDLMSAVIVLATKAKGVTLCHDWMYESRMFFVDKLISMGAHITIADPHRVVIYGPTQLHSRDLDTPDIRAGMALLLAALISEGESTINKANLIERGYEDPVGKLKSLGAQIERIS
jgi:UDP-N-acetylglucosamine 1-carboxyvinyltransferase